MGQMLYGPLYSTAMEESGRFMLASWPISYARLGCAFAHDLENADRPALSRGARRLRGAGRSHRHGARLLPGQGEREGLLLVFSHDRHFLLLAPTIGSTIVAGVGWRWIFGALASMAFAILILIFFKLPGRPSARPLRLTAPRADSERILEDRQKSAIPHLYSCGRILLAGLFAFVAGSPIIFADAYHMGTKTFGIVFAVLVMGFIGGNNVNVFLLRRFTSQQIFLSALIFQVVIGSFFFIGTRGGFLDLKATMALFFFFLSCIGLTYPNGAAIGLAPFSRDAGRASALLGFLQTGTGALISMGIGLLGVQGGDRTAFVDGGGGAGDSSGRQGGHRLACWD